MWWRDGVVVAAVGERVIDGGLVRRRAVVTKGQRDHLAEAVAAAVRVERRVAARAALPLCGHAI